MSKNNVRSFRYSDEIAQLIERSEGSNFSEKFENLVMSAYIKLPQAQEELAHLQALVTAENAAWISLRLEISALNNVKQKITHIERYFEDVENDLKLIGDKAK